MLNILFIGNSHTYFNDLPAIVARMMKDDGYEGRVTMIAHGGWCPCFPGRQRIRRKNHLVSYCQGS